LNLSQSVSLPDQLHRSPVVEIFLEYHRPHRPNRLEITPVLARFKQDGVLRA
jgi:hypothetical protein